MWPVLWQADGTIIYSYPLFIGLAWGLGYRLSEANLPATIRPGRFALWFTGLFIATWIGAKALFVLTQNQYAAVDLVLASNFWLGGGFVFLGGFLGGLLYTVVVAGLSTNFKISQMQFTIVPMLWAHALGRIGCFLAGCCFGTKTELPWAIVLHGGHRHPVQLYEALGLALLAWGLGKSQQRQSFLMQYLLGYGALRWGLEWLRGDEVRGGAWAMSTSQWVSLSMIVLAGVLYYRTVRRRTGAI